MKNYLVVVECAIEHEGKFLIIKRPENVHAAGLLSFPGGKVEECDENSIPDMLGSAAKREVLEEMGIVLEDPLYYITSNYFTGENNIPIIDIVFYCHLQKTTPKIIPSEREVADYYWMTPAEINKAKNSPEWFKNQLSLIIQKTRKLPIKN